MKRNHRSSGSGEIYRLTRESKATWRQAREIAVNGQALDRKDGTWAQLAEGHEPAVIMRKRDGESQRVDRYAAINARIALLEAKLAASKQQPTKPVATKVSVTLVEAHQPTIRKPQPAMLQAVIVPEVSAGPSPEDVARDYRRVEQAEIIREAIVNG